MPMHTGVPILRVMALFMAGVTFRQTPTFYIFNYTGEPRKGSGYCIQFIARTDRYSIRAKHCKSVCYNRPAASYVLAQCTSLSSTMGTS